MGGIVKAEDAIEFILAGASAIQIGTANLVNPRQALKSFKDKETPLENKIHRLRRLIGLLARAQEIKKLPAYAGRLF